MERWWRLVLVVWLEALFWAPQTDLGNGLHRSPQCYWDFCIEQPRDVHRLETFYLDTNRWSQTHTRHSGDVGKMEGLCGEQRQHIGPSPAQGGLWGAQVSSASAS